MYENVTYEGLLRRMLEGAAAIDRNLDTREGSVLWYALAPAAVELQNLYIALDTVLSETYADTASRPYLIKRAWERGIEPRGATKAVCRGALLPEGIEVPAGTRLSGGGLNYTVTGRLEDRGYRLECESPGEQGNGYSGTLLPVEHVRGLERAELTEVLIPGEDEESTESLRKRYFATLDAQAFGGNTADYLEKVSALPGVGGVKVRRAWNGGGTVLLTIIDSLFAAPSAELVASVQERVDPETGHGAGLGLAPIGHKVTVRGAEGAAVNVACTLTYQAGWDRAAVEPYVQAALAGYMKELSKAWAGQEEPLVVRVSRVESELLGCPGVVDVEGTTLNGAAKNLVLEWDQVPVMGTLYG